MIAIGACFTLGLIFGKKNPVVAGAWFAVAFILTMWAPGGLLS